MIDTWAVGHTLRHGPRASSLGVGHHGRRDVAVGRGGATRPDASPHVDGSDPVLHLQDDVGHDAVRRLRAQQRKGMLGGGARGALCQNILAVLPRQQVMMCQCQCVGGPWAHAHAGLGVHAPQCVCIHAQ